MNDGALGFSVDTRHTFLTATETTDGVIPHFNFGGISCPVRIATKTARNGGAPVRVAVETSLTNLPTPEKSPSGKYIYALPGGMGIVP